MLKQLLFLSLFTLSLEASSTFVEARALYEMGEYEKALEIFQGLAPSDPDAAYMLAKMYEDGEGCEVNQKEALKWYKISSTTYYEQERHSPLREVRKQYREIYSSFEKPEDKETQSTLRQYAQSLYNFKAHNPNYILPLSYRYNGDYASVNGHEMKKAETEFQVSVKFDFATNLFRFGEIYSVAYTQRSFWQAYADSAFFRESNYNPEFFVTFPTSEMGDGRLIKAVRLGIGHESNGRGGEAERSWNYLDSSLFFQYKSILAELKLWTRLPDTYDYNPELIDVMGHGYLKFTLPYQKHLLDIKLRNNFSGKGALESNYSYPISSRDDLFFYLKFFNGYGESLIDYDNHIKKIGIGFSISR